MTEETTTYYAILGCGKTVDDPLGIARQRQSSEELLYEIYLRNHPSWHSSGIIAEWNNASSEYNLEEISKERTMQIIESWESPPG